MRAHTTYSAKWELFIGKGEMKPVPDPDIVRFSPMITPLIPPSQLNQTTVFTALITQFYLCMLVIPRAVERLCRTFICKTPGP